MLHKKSCKTGFTKPHMYVKIIIRKVMAGGLASVL